MCTGDHLTNDFPAILVIRKEWTPSPKDPNPDQTVVTKKVKLVSL